MVKIYALMSGEEVLYVGKTVQTLRERARGHRKPDNKCCSKNIPQHVQWEIQLIEECEDEDAAVRERHYIETLIPPYNTQIPGRKRAEYYKEYMKSEEHKEAARAKARRYRLKKKSQ
jgi:hypothetical protein